MPPGIDPSVLLVAAGAFATALFMLFALTGLGAEVEPDPAQRAEPPAALLARIGALAEPTEEVERDALARRLLQAGLRGKRDLDTFLLARTLLALGLPAVLFLLSAPERPLIIALLLLAGAAVGYYAPWVVVDRMRAHRQEAMMAAFPNALDMLVSCLEAGQGLDAALQRVARETVDTSPILAEELDLSNAETLAGVPRSTALRRMADRVGLSEVSSLVNVLVQAERYGAGIADSIRAHAHLVRRRRALAAEERAARATPKLTVVMILFILPTLFIVVLGPAAVNIVEHLLPGLRGIGP